MTSQPQRQPHEKRVRSTTYGSHVLPAAERHQPGVTNNEMETVSTSAGIAVAQNFVLEQNAEASSSGFVIQDVLMLDTNPPLPGLTNQDVTMQDADVPHPRLYSMPGPINDINMHEPVTVFPVLPLDHPFNSGHYAVWGEKKAKKRRCMICVQAGRDGEKCKGKNNRRHCEFTEVCSPN